MLNFLNKLTIFAIVAVCIYFGYDYYTPIKHNGIGYKTIESPYTGRIWLDRNIGATEVCKNKNTKECNGSEFLWGNNAPSNNGYVDKKFAEAVKISEKAGTNIGSAYFVFSIFAKSFTDPDDWTSDDKDGEKRKKAWNISDGTSICPKGFRVPTKEEFNREIESRSDVERFKKEFNFTDITNELWTQTPLGESSAYTGYIYSNDFYKKQVMKIDSSIRNMARHVRCISVN